MSSHFSDVYPLIPMDGTASIDHVGVFFQLLTTDADMNLFMLTIVEVRT
jgi:hypothetical protein